MLTNWIDNDAVPTADGDRLEVTDPAKASAFEEMPRGCRQDVDLAVAAAAAAAPAWAGTAPTSRRDLLVESAQRIRDHRETLARLIVQENGKPLREALAEVDGAARVTASYAELGVHVRSGAQMSATGELNFQHRQPRGVAACIVPWNFPVAVCTDNIVPNLAVGNTVVLKPSEKTPVAARFLVEHVFGHLPSGVCNVVLGDGPSAGEHLISHPDVDVVVFVGSEPTGRHVAEICGRALRKVIVELGGKDAFIVDETTDLGDVVTHAKAAKYLASGQVCTSPERFYVTQPVYEPFVDRFARASAAMKVGSGMRDDTEMGPLIDELQLARVAQHVSDARAAGATIHCGGEQLDGPGYFYLPTVVTDAPDGVSVMEEETFGPVAPIVAVEDFEQAIALANASRFGLSAMVCTNSARNAMIALDRLEAGMIRINTRLGKVPGATSEPFKSSGVGHGYGIEFLHELTRQKSVYWHASL